MSLWTSNFLGQAFTNHVKDVYNALHGLMGRSNVTSCFTRGLGSREARSSSVDKGAGCAEAADSDMGHIMFTAVSDTFESTGEPVRLRRRPHPDAAWSACVPCLAVASANARDLVVTSMSSHEPQTANLARSGSLAGPSLCLI